MYDSLNSISNLFQSLMFAHIPSKWLAAGPANNKCHDYRKLKSTKTVGS